MVKKLGGRNVSVTQACLRKFWPLRATEGKKERKKKERRKEEREGGKEGWERREGGKEEWREEGREGR